jgi:type IV pilus assembly protein PilX
MKPQIQHFAAPQRGVSLIIVMLVLLLCSLLALGAARMGWLGEALVGNISDEQRAQLAAEALMRDAQLDIQNPLRRPPNDANALYYPLSGAIDLTELQARVASEPVPCKLGLCFPATLQTLNGTGDTNWWQQGDPVVANMRAAGARFGQITGAANTLNPLLNPGNTRLAHYWIEAFLITPEVSSMAPAMMSDRPYIYRVTVVVDGLKAGTRVVLQSLMSP